MVIISIHYEVSSDLLQTEKGQTDQTNRSFL